MSTLTPRMLSAFRSFQTYRKRRADMRALSEMDDALLKDIGLNRSEIYSATHGLKHRG